MALEERTARASELHDPWESFVIKVLEFVRGKLEKGAKVPEFPWERLVLMENGSLQARRVVSLEWADFLAAYEDELTGLREYKSLASIMRNDPSVARHTDQFTATPTGALKTRLWSYAVFLVLQQLDDNPTATYDKGKFERNFRKLLNYLSKETVTINHIAPLYNFEAAVEEISLEPGLRMRKITKEEVEHFANSTHESGQMFYQLVTLFKFVVELAFESRKDFARAITPASEDGLQPYHRIDELVTALRLFKPGNVGYQLVRRVPEIRAPGILGGTIGKMQSRYFAGRTYSLNSSEADEFKKFWETFRTTEPLASSFNVTLRRFNFAYDRFQPEDKLVDFMIAFEALFLKRDESSEMGHRLSVRVAKLLEDSFEDRKKIQREMKDLYGKRSSVVHGDQTEIGGELVERTEDRLRQSIRLFLPKLRKQSQDELLSRLDLDT